MQISQRGSVSTSVFSREKITSGSVKLLKQDRSGLCNAFVIQLLLTNTFIGGAVKKLTLQVAWPEPLKNIPQRDGSMEKALHTSPNFPWKSSEIFGECLEIFEKWSKTSLPGYLYIMNKIIRQLIVDILFSFSCSTVYLICLFARFRVENSKRNSISTPAHYSVLYA